MTRPCFSNPTSSFTMQVLDTVRKIPVGQIATYGDIAAIAGHPHAYRAVGNIMRNCCLVDVPCHRVVAAKGRLGGYSGNPTLKRQLLRAEGIQVSRTAVRNFTKIRWRHTAHNTEGDTLTWPSRQTARDVA